MHNSAEITRLLHRGRPLVFVASFPRSGNTWVRYLLADVFLQIRGVETTTELPVHPDRIVPDFYCNWIARRETALPSPAVFVKIHDSFGRLQERFGGVLPRGGVAGSGASASFRRCKHVYIYRSPEDALVSLYHFFAAQRQFKAQTTDGIDAFCLTWLAQWEENLGGYLRAAEEGFPVLFVPYELVLQYPAEIVGRLLHWLGVEHEGKMVERAVSNMQFSKLQALEASTRTNEEVFFFRRGCQGSGRSELQETTMNIIQERTAHLMEQAHARVLMQQAQGRPASSKTTRIRRDAAFQNQHAKPVSPATKLQKV
jgi:hypothetical protein